MHSYAPLAVRVTTPRLELRAATDDLLDQLAPLVRAGEADADPPPYDDPSSFYTEDPDERVEVWMRGIWRGRGTVAPDKWRLYFVVMADGRPVGMQDIIGDHFADYGTVVTFSWLAQSARGRGLGREMRRAALHLAFDGLGAAEAGSDAFADNAGSNAVSRSLGYEPNGTEWDSRRGEAAVIQRWRLTREAWAPTTTADITVEGVEACRRSLGIG
jgi:RimJ/RimL family protein N-acetyltransferase